MKWLILKLMKLMVRLYFFVNKDAYAVGLGTKHPNYDFSVTKHIYPDEDAKWIYGDFDKDHHWVSGSKKVRCSACWRVFDSDNLNIWNWCPHCGVRVHGVKGGAV